jgi:hypothetical protein
MVTIGILALEQIVVSASIHEAVYQNSIRGSGIQGFAVLEFGRDMPFRSAIGKTCNCASAAQEVFQYLLAREIDQYYFIFERPYSHDVGTCDLSRRDCPI